MKPAVIAISSSTVIIAIIFAFAWKQRPKPVDVSNPVAELQRIREDVLPETARPVRQVMPGMAQSSQPNSPPILVNALRVFEEYTSNEAAADAKYTGRQIQVGIPYQPQFHKPFRLGNDYCLIVRHPFNWNAGMEFPPPLVLVRFANAEDAAKLVEAAQEQKLVITGHCTGLTEQDIFYGRYVGLNKASLVLDRWRAGENPIEYPEIQARSKPK